MNISNIIIYKDQIISPLIGAFQAMLINSLIYFISKSLGFIPKNIYFFGTNSFSITQLFITEIFLGIISVLALIYLTNKYEKNLNSYFMYFTIFVLAIIAVFPILVTFASLQLIVTIELMNVISAICIYASVSRRIFNK